MCSSTFFKDPFDHNTALCLDGRLTREKTYPTEAGGYADVYEGFLGSQKVAIKVVRSFRLQRDKLLRRLWREYLAWSCLTHPNILSCLGYSYNVFPGSYMLPSLISPWMENGNVMSYLQSHPDVDRIQLLAGVADGLSYLHSRKRVIVHGDVRAGNILVSDEGVPCLTDFGLSRILEEIGGMTTTSDLAGSVRWMSPELFQNDGKVSVHSDVWAYGMTILEILSGERPYSAIKNDVIVLGQVRDCKLPSRPQSPKHLEVFNDRVWAICKRCWCLEPTARPSMKEVARMIIPPVQIPIAAKDEGITAVIPVEQKFSCVPDVRPVMDASKLTARVTPGHIFCVQKSYSVSCFSFSRDGRYLAVGSLHTVEIYDTSSGSQERTLEFVTPGILVCLCFSPEGGFLATGDVKGIILVWKIKKEKTCEMIKLLDKHGAPVSALEFSSDGRFLVSAGGVGRKVRIWNMKTYQHKVLHIGLKCRKHVWSKIVAFSPDGQLLAVGRKHHVYLWDVWRCVVLEQLNGCSAMVTSVAFTPDGKRLISGTCSGEVNIWDLSPFLRSSRKNERLEWGIDSRRESEKGSRCLPGIRYPGEVLRFVGVSGDGRVVITSSETGCVRFWDSHTKESAAGLQLFPAGPIAVSVWLNPATGMIASVGEKEHSTRLWNYDILFEHDETVLATRS